MDAEEINGQLRWKYSAATQSTAAAAPSPRPRLDRGAAITRIGLSNIE